MTGFLPRYRAARFAMIGALLLATVSHAESSGTPVLIELFTAEGCSSCPPADAFLGQLDATQPIAGAHLIVLSEHVDYWDHQGWPDPYASKEFTARQVAYERSLHVTEPFTPQFVVDGSIDMRLSRRDRIKAQLQEAAANAKVSVNIESLSVTRGVTPEIRGVVVVDASKDDRPCDLLIALALDHTQSDVLRGENRGQHLTHVAVLRDLVHIGTISPKATSRQAFTVPLLPGLDSAPLRIIAFVQRTDFGKVVGATERIAGM